MSDKDESMAELSKLGQEIDAVVGDHNPMIKPEYVGRDYPLLDKVIWIIKEKAFKADSLAFEYQGTHVEKIYQQWHADLNDAIKQTKAIKAKSEVSE
mgnify:CR=1 FL=1